MMLSEEFVASRVYAGDVERAEHDRELVRRLREERAARRAERVAGRRAHRETRAFPEAAAEPIAAAPEAAAEPVQEAAPDQRRELAHAGR